MTEPFIDLRNPLDRIESRLEREIEVARREMLQRDATVRELLEDKTEANDLRIREAFSASEKAIEKALASMNARFDAVNEFRGELGDRWAQTLPREVYEVGHKELTKRLEILELAAASDGGALEAAEKRQKAFIGQIGAAVAVIAVVAAVLGPHIH